RTLLERIEAYDPSTLTQVAEFARLAQWPEASFFERVARDRQQAPLFHDPGSATVPLELQFLVSRDRPESLRSTGSDEPIDINRLEWLLGPQGPLTHVLEHYEPRPTQVTMARAVAQALNEDEKLLVEAGTGTGKSLAYLLPAAISAVTRGE